MHLNKFEYNGILAAIRREGYQQDKLLFRKKAGWVKIQLEGVGELFQFHRKKVTQIVDGRFKDHYQYRIKVNGVIQSVDSWQNVKAEFETWLSEI